MHKLALIPLVMGLAAAYVSAQAPAAQAPAAPGAKATLKDAQGKTLGEATLRESAAAYW